MNKKIAYWVISAGVALVVLFYAFNAYIYNQKQGGVDPATSAMSFNVTPISHASAVMYFGGTVVYVDPVGGAEAFDGQPAADVVLITDIHGDHLNTETLSSVIGDATLIVPEAVKKELPESLALRAKVLNNGEKILEQGLDIEAIPMYNLPETADSRHVKGRGNGYVIEQDGFRGYIAGDTAGIPEMLALTDIDVAFVPMNIPYTMTVEEAAEAVLVFAPKKVYPYHYRGQDGLSDVNKFKELVDKGGKNIEVVLLEWYKAQ